MSLQEWECLVIKKIGDDVSGDFAQNAGLNRFNGIADFADDMTSYADQTAFDANWVTTNSSIIRGNPSTDVIDHTTQLDAAFDIVCNFDLWSHGIFPSDTNWTLRVTWDFTTVTNPGGAQGVNISAIIGLTDLGLATKIVSQDFIVVRGTLFNGGTLWRGYSGENIILNTGNVFELDHAVQVETLFVELKRTSVTTFEITFYSDATFTTTIEKGRGTIIGNPTNLRFITIGLENQGGVSGRILDGTLTDIQFFNNTEGTVDSFVLHGDEDLKPFEEFVPAGSTKFFDFSNDTGWVFQGGVIISGGTLNGWGNEGGTVRRGIYDLFVNDSFKMNDTKWTVDVDYIFTAANIPAHFPFAFADSSAVMLGTGSPFPNSIAIFQADNTGGPGLVNLRILTTNDSNFSVGTPVEQGIEVLVNVQYFLRFERLSVSKLKLSVFLDSARTIHTTGSPIQLEPLVNALTNMFFIHSANAPQGGNPRSLTGSIDNLAIFNGVSSENDLIVFDDFSTYGTPVTPDFTDTFDSFDWTTTNTTRVRIEDDQGFAFAMSPPGQIVKAVMTLDLQTALGQAIDDNEWVLRFKMANTFIAEGGDNTSNQVGFGISSEDFNSDTDNLQNYIQFVSRTAIPSAGAGGQYSLRAGQNLSLRNTGINPSIEYIFNFKPLPMTVKNSLLFVEVTRLSSTTAVCRIYSDENYSDLIESSGVQTINDVQSLRFLKIWAENTDGTANGEIEQTFDDVQFWNGRSATCDPAGLGTATKTITGADDANFVQTGSQVTISGGIISGWGPDGSVQGITYDLQAFDGLTLDDTKWVVESKWEVTLVGTSSGHFILALADKPADITFLANNVSMISLVVNKQVGPDPQINARLTASVGGTFFQSTGIGIESFPGTDLFVRLQRVSPTVFQLNLAFDLAQTNQLPGSPITLTDPSFTGITGLDHIQSRVSTTGSSSRNVSGTVRDIKIFNGTVAALIPWVSSDLPDIFVDICQENIVFQNMVIPNDPKNITLDLGSSLSNEKFVLRWSMVFGELDIGVASNLFIGMSDEDQNSEAGDSQSFIMARIQNSVSGLTLSGISANNGLMGGTVRDDPQDITWEINRKYFFEIVRDSTTTYKVSVFDDADYTFPLTVSNCTVANTVIGLRFFKIINIESGNPITGEFAGVFDDLKIWDGVDVADSFGSRRYLQALQKIIPLGTVSALGRFNLDAQNNGAFRDSFNGEVDVTAINRPFVMAFVGGLGGATSFSDPIFMESSIYNQLSDEKLVQSHQVDRELLGSGTPPNRVESVAKWTNVITKVSRIKWDTGTAVFDTDTEGVIFGSEQ